MALIAQDLHTVATVTKLPSGKFRAQVRKQGVYRARTFDRKADAKAWGVDVERAIAGGSVVGSIRAPKDMTLGDVLEAYLKQLRVGRTIQAHLTGIKSRIGKTPINRLSAVTLRDYVESRKADGAGGVTLAGDLSNLSSALKWVRHVRNLDIDADLATQARQALTAERIDTGSRERTRIPTQEEIEMFCAHFEATPRQTIPMGTIIRFAAASAMRLGEICRIRIEDISWNEKAVLIHEWNDPQYKAGTDQQVPLVGTVFDIARTVAEGRSEGRLRPYSAKSASTSFKRTPVHSEQATAP